jgi:NDP-sugar pyrophosphorylase family protein
LELLLRQLRRSGLRRVILAIGYRGNEIREFVDQQCFDLTIEYSPETTPLGTGGAVRNACDRIRSDQVLVMNGDSYTDVDLGRFVAHHRAGTAEVTMVVVSAAGRDDVGSVRADEAGRVIRFDEKQAPTIEDSAGQRRWGGESLPASRAPHAVPAGRWYVNAGIYLMSRAIVADMPGGVASSLEREVFPQWLADGREIRVFVHEGTCMDIGTPDRYQAAQASLAGVEKETSVTGDSRRK